MISDADMAKMRLNEVKPAVFKSIQVLSLLKPHEPPSGSDKDMLGLLTGSAFEHMAALAAGLVRKKADGARKVKVRDPSSEKCVDWKDFFPASRYACDRKRKSPA